MTTKSDNTQEPDPNHSLCKGQNQCEDQTESLDQTQSDGSNPSFSRDLVVAFDTSSDYIALAVGRLEDSEPLKFDMPITLLAADDHPAQRQANVQLMPSIEALFKQYKLDKRQVAAVVCGLGPGSFTGVRIGVATAKGIARGLDVPLYGVSTLDAIAWNAWEKGVLGYVGIAADAMRGEVYPARYMLKRDGAHRLDPHTVAKADTVAKLWVSEGIPISLAGEGLRKHWKAFLDNAPCCKPFFGTINEELWKPTGQGLLLAFTALCVSGKQGSGEPGSLLPIYTRLSDAEENERKRLTTGGQITQGAMVEMPRCGVSDPTQVEEIVCRPMAIGDVELVAQLEQASFSAADAWSLRMFTDDLGQLGRDWWVACLGDKLIGYAGGWLIDGDIQVLRVAVLPEFRQKGVARHLIEQLARDGFELGATSISLEVRASNCIAISLYESLGMTSEGNRPGYYPASESGQPREDAVILRGELPLRRRPTERQDVAVSDNKAAIAFSRDYAADSLEKTSKTNDASRRPRVIAIETSCDETAAAIIDGEGDLLANVIASQVDFHSRFGGVVPEIASRKHTEAIVGVVDQALEDAEQGLDALDAIAVTYAPGLIGALVVGVAFAKGLSWATDLPLIRVNHLEGHIYANRIATKTAGILDEGKLDAGKLDVDKLDAGKLEPPFVIALLSGGHTMLVHVRDWGDYDVLGKTLDDAVGEAFDKVAKALGLGYPGGPVISRLASEGDPGAIDFPRALLHSKDLRFSLSGLKTAVITYIKREQAAGRTLVLADIAASFQQAVIDVQTAKALKALEQTGAKTFCLGGGVAANSALRKAYKDVLQAKGYSVTFPPDIACTDNAAMIAAVALDRYHAKRFMSLADDAHAQADLEQAY
ncbi:MAG: tRNA (adenosine(37)-N6)-threonylcarbamoyltransferase complex transferase subunit TsaD [Coriobacteriaceae bacterium]|nr:tRNA (adenosine(37)-N6)-threonylcarbamoyltransferase complex transferase subunit TsaD [Coriobacteriaceae bacterium]